MGSGLVRVTQYPVQANSMENIGLVKLDPNRSQTDLELPKPNQLAGWVGLGGLKPAKLAPLSRTTRFRHPPDNWFKWNKNASRLDSTSSTMTSYVYRRISEKIIEKFEYRIRDNPIIIMNTMSIKEAIRYELIKSRE